jgi:hypothetical protein
MSHWTRRSHLLLAVLALVTASAVQAGQNRYSQHDLQGPIEAVLPDGEVRTLNPSCSGGPMPGDSGPVAANTDYYFFVQKANPTRLMFFFDGGGACWDAFTCISLALAGQAPYTQELNETERSMSRAGGILDRHNQDNPVRNFTKIFIPYCSADIHFGATDTTYEAGGLEWTIRHRGTDNFLAVLDWLQKNGKEAYGIDFDQVKNVLITGSSAGGYGATAGFPYIAAMTPNSRHHLISDAAIGALTPGFYKSVIYDANDPQGANWGVLQGLPKFVPGLDESMLAQIGDNVEDFTYTLYNTLAAYKPKSNLATLNSNLDNVQILFYSIMAGASPESVAGDWFRIMEQTNASLASIPNFRFLTDNGAFHTFLSVDEQTYEPGATGVRVIDWLKLMVQPGRSGWENLDAGPPVLPAEAQ